MKPCGTHTAYSQHYKRGEAPCPPCIEGHSEYMRDWWRQNHPPANTTPRVIDDYVETHGPIEVTPLVEIIQGRHDIKDATIRRAVWRMVNDGRLVASYDPLYPLTVEVP